ncbi:Sds3-like-domain-containing protein [Xylariales sp. AK1849]|nr:Sds3-like-domain-containing protein [Xylariales sp. AK1849]
MATGDTAPPLTIPPPPIEPLSDDDGSSPLSDLGGSQNDLDQLEESSNLDRDNESSDEANDTEAETERLYPTPQNPTRQKDVFADGQVFERTPTKLRHENTTLGEGADDDEEPLSSEREASIVSSPPPTAPEAAVPRIEKLQSPTLGILAEAAANQELENRKRKRTSVPAEQPEADQPLRKRAGSAAAEDHDGDVAMADDEDPSMKTNSSDESVIPAAADEEQDERADDADAEAQIEEESRARKATRSVSRKRKSPRTGSGDSPEEAPEGTTADEEGAHTGDDEHMEVDVNEEAEAAHRNEEERMRHTLIPNTSRKLTQSTVERKKAAFEQLTSIEKRFATFRDRYAPSLSDHAEIVSEANQDYGNRLYEERLEQLNREEAMLKSDTPTHHEYLAMMECIDVRRDEKLRIAEKEYEFNMESTGRWAVARRAQIHSQYFQDIREHREKAMAELGQHWYAIQAQRRTQANNVPDYGIRYPESQAQRVRDALAYNKEVSILSGIAKYEGMPGAPEMHGASMQELDDDFEAMNQGRQPAPQLPPHLSRAVYSEYGGLPLSQALGAAGEQFLEQTPWANPNHPSNAHLLQRQNSIQNEHRKRSPLPDASGSRRHSHQPNLFSSSTISTSSNHFPTINSSNGIFPTHKSVPRQMTTSPEVTRAATLLEQSSARGIKAAAAAVAAAAAAASASEQGTAVKREAAAAVGGF